MKKVLAGLLLVLASANTMAIEAETQKHDAESEYRYEGVGSGDKNFLVALRLGVAESYNVTVKGVSIDNIDEGFTGASVGIRIGYLLDRWTTSLEYTPAAEMTFEKQAVDVESLVLATDYAVWRSANRKHQIGIGGFVSRLKKSYTTDINGLSFGSNAIEADGLSYGLLTNYRWNLASYFYVGGEFQYGLNGVDGPGNKNAGGNFSSTGIDNYYRVNILAGFRF